MYRLACCKRALPPLQMVVLANYRWRSLAKSKAQKSFSIQVGCSAAKFSNAMHSVAKGRCQSFWGVNDDLLGMVHDSSCTCMFPVLQVTQPAAEELDDD